MGDSEVFFQHFVLMPTSITFVSILNILIYENVIKFILFSSCECLGFEISWDPCGSGDEIGLEN